MKHIKHSVAATILAFSFASTAPALALEKISLGFTAVNGNAPDLIAKDQGFFTKHGLDVDITLVRGGNVLIPSLVANSMQIGTVGASTLLQAADGGIDLVALTNLSIFSPGMKDSGIVVRKDGSIKTVADLKGKRVGTSTIGGVSEIIFDKWLTLSHVDPKNVTMVEIAYAEMPDVIKAGNVDGVLIPDPFMSSILSAGTGTVLSYFYGEIGQAVPALVNASTRVWADAHPQEIAAFRAAVGDAVAFAKANPEKTKEIVGKAFGLKPEVAAKAAPAPVAANLTVGDLQWWLDTMNEQGRLRSKLDAGRLIAP
jgi:NitT/TauT family transport system substrate-binding protein